MITSSPMVKFCPSRNQRMSMNCILYLPVMLKGVSLIIHIFAYLVRLKYQLLDEFVANFVLNFADNSTQQLQSELALKMQ